MILVLADIRDLLLTTPYSADKLVPFSPFSNRKMIDGLFSIERTDDDRLCFKDMMIGNNCS